MFIQRLLSPSTKISYLTRSEFVSKVKELQGGHWTEELLDARWDYHMKAKEIVRSLNPSSPNSVLEMGTMGINIVRNSDTLDYDERWDFPGKKPTFLHDARLTPWPIPDKQYQVIIALRVFQHLVPFQREAFLECIRVSTQVIIVVPRWYLNQILPNARGVTYWNFVEFLNGIHPTS